MKRSKNDHIRSTISRYFKRRQFTEGEMPSRKEARREQAITDMSVRRQTRLGACNENTLALTSISGDATAFDQQFTRLKNFIHGAQNPHRKQLEAALFPMFIGVYLEMLCNGQKMPAHKFHERHSHLFQEERHQPLLLLTRQLETKSEVLTNKSIGEFRDNRTVLEVSQGALDLLMEFLEEEDNMIILQVFNQYAHACVKGGILRDKKIELNSHPEVKEEERDGEVSNQAPTEPVEEGEPQQQQQQQQQQQHQGTSLLEDLESAIKAVRELPPCLPSICFFTFMNTYQGLCSATLSQDKLRLSGCFEDASISVWSLEPHTFSSTSTDCDPSRVTLAADLIHCTENERREHLNWRCTQNSERMSLRGHRGSVYKTRFLKDSTKHLISCSEDCTVRLWNLSTQTNSVIYKGHTSPVWDVHLSSTDTWFASCSNDTTAKLWSFDRTYPLRSYIGHSMDVDCVDFHPNNNYLATGSADKTVRLWSVTEGRTVRLLQGHRGSVLALAYSPNGKLLASAGEDRRVRVWDLGSGHLVKELRGHSDTVYALAFDEHSRMLASGGADCCLRLWDISRTSDTQVMETHSSPELLGAFPTKSALVSFLSFTEHNVLLAAGASS